MQVYTSPILSFLGAFIVTYFSILNSVKFHNFFFLIAWHGKLFLYCFVYGAISLCLFYILKNGVIKITDDNTKIGNYIYPLAIGIATKGISDLSLLNINANGVSFPLGVKTFTQPIDKYFESLLDGICFRKYLEYLKPYVSKYQMILESATYNNDLTLLKSQIIGTLKSNHPDKTKTRTFEASDDFIKTKNIGDLLTAVLTEFGPDVFNSVFPIQV